MKSNELFDVSGEKTFCFRGCHLHHSEYMHPEYMGTTVKKRYLMGGAFMGCLMARKKDSKLVFVEYLESGGIGGGTDAMSYCIVDTGIVPTETTRWELDMRMVTTNYDGVNGLYGGGNRFCIGVVGGNWYLRLGSSGSSGSADTIRHRLYLDASSRSCGIMGGQSWPTEAFVPSGQTIALFARNNGASSSPAYTHSCPVRVFQSRIIISGTEVQNLVPAVVDGIACMYDTVSGNTFNNLGRGQLIAGPEIGIA